MKPDVAAPGVDIMAARAAGTVARRARRRLLHLDLEAPRWRRRTSRASPRSSSTPHPGWDGERIKAVLAGRPFRHRGATAFEAGTGRVDGARAIATTLVAPTSLNLGSFPWPHNDPEPSTTTLTYRNLAPSPVTLDLSLAAEDGIAAAPDGVTLSADTLVVPADGVATVDLLLDPSAAGIGTSSGVVTAEEEGGRSACARRSGSGSRASTTT